MTGPRQPTGTPLFRSVSGKDFRSKKKYTKVPTVNDWQAATKKIGQNDPAINLYLTDAIREYWTARNASEKNGGLYRLDLMFALFNIYVSTSEWLRSITRNPANPQVERERLKKLAEPVRQLHWHTSDELMARMKLNNEMELDKRLKSLFEVEMTEHGEGCDRKAKALRGSGGGLKYLEADEMRIAVHAHSQPLDRSVVNSPCRNGY